MSATIVTFTLMAAAMLLIAVLLIFALNPKTGQGATIKRRVAMVTGQGSAAPTTLIGSERNTKKRSIQSRLKEIEQSKTRKKPTFSARFRKDLENAGLRIGVQTFFIICTVLAIVSAGVYLLLGYPEIGVLPVAITAGFGVPKFVVGWLRNRRINKFTKEFANAVDVIVRGIRSGLPVGECLKIIALESPEPVCSVFREMVEAQKLGMSLEQAMQRAEARMSTAELKFFAIVLQLQAQTGGNLAETLSNLSKILRERKKMADKVKALSSEAKASAMIIGSLPFIMVLLLYLVNRPYITLLFTDELGNLMIGGGLIWMSMGILIMRQMINFEI